MKLPTVPPGGKPLSLNDKIGLLRAATGKPERCEILVVCSADRKMPTFSQSFERMHPGEKFKLVETEGGGRAEPAKSGNRQPAGSASTFRADDFESYGTVCPYCGGKGRVRCEDCAKLYCSGAKAEEQGAEVFHCPTCKKTLTLSDGRNNPITAQKTVAPSAPGGLLGHIKQGLLPGRK